MFGDTNGIREKLGLIFLIMTGSTSRWGFSLIDCHLAGCCVDSSLTISGTIPGVLALIVRWCVLGFVFNTLGVVGFVDVVISGAFTL